MLALILLAVVEEDARYPKGYLKGIRSFPQKDIHKTSGEARNATKANANLPPQSTHIDKT